MKTQSLFLIAFSFLIFNLYSCGSDDDNSTDEQTITLGNPSDFNNYIAQGTISDYVFMGNSAADLNVNCYLSFDYDASQNNPWEEVFNFVFLDGTINVDSNNQINILGNPTYLFVVGRENDGVYHPNIWDVPVVSGATYASFYSDYNNQSNSGDNCGFNETDGMGNTITINSINFDWTNLRGTVDFNYNIIMDSTDSDLDGCSNYNQTNILFSGHYVGSFRIIFES